MKPFVCACLLSLSSLAIAAHAADASDAATKAAPVESKPIPKEDKYVTHHSISIGGVTIKYTATFGNLVIKNDKDEPVATLSYVAYTQDGANTDRRPLTFLYNGGPGSSSIWLHMGAFGPMRVVTSNAERKDFWGVDQDVDAFGRFIQRYLSVNGRWNSPKFLLGESYGTTRSANLADWLQNKGVALNGVILVSSVLNYGDTFPGTDLEYVTYLPSYAAIAWYHDKLPNKPADLKAFLDEVRAFARGEYADALFQGDNLPADKYQDVLHKL